MRKRVTLLVSLYSLSYWIAVPTIVNAGEEVVKLIQNIKPAVVLIQTFDANSQPIGQGSGFFIDNKGSVITNYHVIEGAYSATIKTSTSKEYPVQGIIAKDTEADIVKLSVNITDSNISFLNLSTSIPAEGEDVIVIGNPLGLESSVSTGIISSVRDIPAFGKILQITAAVSAGSSGSPVLNSKGEVIGIATLILTEGQNLNFAIPSDKIIALKETPPIAISEALAEVTDDMNDAQSFYDKGLKELWQENWSAALACFKRAVAENPQDAESWFFNGYCYSKLSHDQEAILSYKQAIQIKPDYADAHNGLGNACLQLGSYQDAIESCKQALRIEPDYFEAHLNIGIAYCQLGHYEESINFCKQAIRIRPDSVGAHYILGLSYLLVGDEDSALQEYNSLKNLDVESANELLSLISSSGQGGTEEPSASENANVSEAVKPFLYHNSEGHFSFTLPSGWVEISKDTIETYCKVLREKFGYTSASNYNSAFQKISATDFAYPYIMLQIDKSGRWPEDETKKLLSSDNWEKGMQQGLHTVEEQLPTLIQNTKVGQTIYDKEKNIVFTQMESEVAGVGKVVTLAALILSNYGSVNIYCNSTKDDYENDLPYFTQIVNSFRYDIGYEYNQFTKKGGDTASESLLGVGLIVFVCVGLAALVVIIVARKSSRRSNNFPETLQTSAQPSTSGSLSSSGEESTQMVLASSWQRFGNMLLDAIFYYVFAFILGIVLYSIGLGELIQNINENILGMIIIIIYYVTQEAFFGRTLGKLITGTKAVNEDGTNLTFGRALGRTLCRFIPFEAFSFLGGKGMPRGWHDRIPKTKVISLRRTSKVVTPNSGIL